MRFGIVLTPRSGGEWTSGVQRAEEQGYGTVLLPDTLFTPSPFPTLAAAAAVTTTLRLRPNVLAAPLRTTAALVRETTALQMLSDGRFELGLGTGRPEARGEAEQLGMPWGSGADRRRQVIEAIAAVRAQVRPAPPMVVAASGPRMLAVAAEYADRVHLAVDPATPESGLAEIVAAVRDRTDRVVSFTLQLVGVGTALPYFVTARLGHTADSLRGAGAAALLPADPEESAALLTHYREKYGIDELLVPGELASAFEPVLAHLRSIRG
ncbi:LLM class flavin-dependent oxidoreductase [Nocardia otitidiscaviarum]|uniref:LLM class flavin-dependent oxidoreductase n=2 Tax=Nocardia otitidiscaviarum TaxID=1823 RepID=A0A516NY84_9NOCA|nr:LLM class flavin-dependent oxidoreductase [Nocardia otitidiscaviarum]